MDKIEASIIRRLLRGKGIFKCKLTLFCFKCNEVGHFASKCLNISKRDINDKRDYKYKKNEDYKDKGKKFHYIAEKDHTESDLIMKMKQFLSKFKLKDIGQLKYFLSIEITRSK